MKPITLVNMSESSKQEVFDWVAYNLLKQGERSLDNNGFCEYRGNNGLKCAAGFCIADDEYDEKKFSGREWRDLIDEGIVPEDDNTDLIRRLQGIHDYYTNNEWKDELSILANGYQLNTEILNQF
jgi:hypothetical protein